MASLSPWQQGAGPARESHAFVCSTGDVGCPPRSEDSLVEVLLLLPGWKLAALEAVARRRELTTGALVRRLIRDFLAGLNDTTPAGRAKPPDGESPWRYGRGSEWPQGPDREELSGKGASDGERSRDRP